MTTRRVFLGRLLGGLVAAPLAKLLPAPQAVEPALAPIAEFDFPVFFPSGETVYLELSNEVWDSGFGFASACKELGLSPYVNLPHAAPAETA